MDATTLNFVLGIAGALLTALLGFVGKQLWDVTGELRVLKEVVKGLSEDVKELTILVNQGRKWRWESGLGPKE